MGGSQEAEGAERLPPFVMIDEEVVDKYGLVGLPEIDCESRYPICRAACCTLRFPLSRQDLDEGVVEWDPVLRYLIKQGPSGFCTHLDLGSCRCTVYGQRPGACRTYSCADDERIWLDFEARIPNPRLWTRTWRLDDGAGGAGDGGAGARDGGAAPAV